MKGALLSILCLLTSHAVATTYPMTMHTVMDNKGVHGVAFRYLAPKGWKTSSSLSWTGNAISPSLLTVLAASPDDRFGFLTISSLDFQFKGHGPSSYGGQGYQMGKQPPRVLSDFLLEHVKRVWPKARIEVTKREDKPITGAALPFRRNFGMVSQLEFTFTDEKGRPCTGVVAARCDGNLQQTDGGMGAIYGGDWRVENLVLASGPKGEEKRTLKFFALSAPTITATREFIALRYAYVDMLNDKMKADMKAQFEAGQLRFRATQDQYAKGNAAWRERESAMDKSLQGFKDYIGDVERYRGADGEEIKATSTPGGAWEDASGNVMLSDNPHYNPNGLRPEIGGWKRLQKAH